MKKNVIKKILLFAFVIGCLLIPSLSFAHLEPYPSNSHNLPYMTLSYSAGSASDFLVYSSSPLSVVDTTIINIASGVGYEMYTVSNNAWSPVGSYTVAQSLSQLHNQCSIELNLSSPSYYTASITSPVNSQTYTTPPDINIPYAGSDIYMYLNEGTVYDYAGHVSGGSPFVVDGGEVPYKTGSNTLIVSHHSIISQDYEALQTVTFTYNPTNPKASSLTGITDGSSLSKLPYSVSAYYNSGYNVVSLYINDTKVWTNSYWERNHSNTKVFVLANYSSMFHVGTNTITLKDTSNNVVMNAISFLLTKEPTGEGLEDSSDSNNIPSFSISDMPVKPTGTDALEWIKYTFDMFLWLVLLPFNFLVTVVSSLFSVVGSLISLFGSLPTIMQTVFAFVPSGILNLLYLAVVAFLVLAVIRFIRRG